MNQPIQRYKRRVLPEVLIVVTIAFLLWSKNFWPLEQVLNRAKILQQKHCSSHFEITTSDTLQNLLSQLLPDGIAQSHQAAIKGSDYQIFQLIDQLSAEYAPSIDTLTIWENGFHSNKVLDLIQQVTS